MRLVVAALAIVLAGCAASGPSSPNPSARPKLGVSNGTTLTVAIFVNGGRLADVPPGGPERPLDVDSLPPLPWTVEARSPSGRVLTSMAVKPGDVTTSSSPGGNEETGAMGRVDLSCGRLTIWAGDVLPLGPAPASPPGSPGDCVP
jgi:hypothetical protein